MSDCPRKGKLIGGCKFEPVFDTEPPGPEPLSALSQPIFLHDIEAMTARTFAGAVCVRCGDIRMAPINISHD